jgi:transcriptional regulator with XRE-family HTH domain
MPRKAPDSVDVLVGRNIRIQRLKRGLSQEALGNALGITFQQVQKYEKGANRVGSGRLHQIANIFKIPVTTLFEGADSDIDGAGTNIGLLADPQVLRMAQAMSEIADDAMRRSIVDLVERIAAGAPSRGLVRRRAAAGRAPN